MVSLLCISPAAASVDMDRPMRGFGRQVRFPAQLVQVERSAEGVSFAGFAAVCDRWDRGAGLVLLGGEVCLLAIL
jgi:hypothetical protein